MADNISNNIPNDIKNSKPTLQSVSFLVLLACMIFLVAKLFLPYFSILLWSAVTYILISPLYHKIIGKMNASRKGYGIKRRFLAGLFSVLTALIVVGVFSFVIVKIFGQGKIIINNITVFFENLDNIGDDSKKNELVAKIYSLSRGTIDLSGLDIKGEFLRIVSIYSDKILHSATSIVKNASSFLLSIVFFAFTLYFFYLDGAFLLKLLKHSIPIDDDKIDRIFNKIGDITTELFKGLFLVSFYQFIAAFIIYLLFGVQGSLLLALLTFFSSFLPMVGCGLIWFPIGIGLCFSQGLIKGGLFLIAAGGIISSMDNFLRPYFLKDRINIHPLLIFFSMLGGIQMFAFDGIILGPMIVILFFTILNMALEQEKAIKESL